ncbi:hypothetical protein NPIL_371261 [Nephila pilipes]|uniref:Uncharacterized protein n=1 Tax=Nephila pilipes TaxID=299642 RepID=A0A8X6QIF3_NEPPI|nr:hypothetical protein NPIL_371261 [Nephila pilipes]
MSHLGCLITSDGLFHLFEHSFNRKLKKPLSSNINIQIAAIENTGPKSLAKFFERIIKKMEKANNVKMLAPGLMTDVSLMGSITKKRKLVLTR